MSVSISNASLNFTDPASPKLTFTFTVTGGNANGSAALFLYANGVIRNVQCTIV